MNGLRILIVDDDPDWRKTLEGISRQLGGSVSVYLAEDYTGAIRHVKSDTYDLVIVDLVLPDGPPGKRALGMDLLRELRESPRSRNCGLVVLTAYSTIERVRQALRDYAVDDFTTKQEFNDTSFIQVARTAIFKSRLRQATERSKQRYRLTVTFNTEFLMESVLIGPDRHADYIADPPLRFDVTDLARRADNLNWMILEIGGELWRPEARSIGNEVYQVVSSDRRILGDLTSGRKLADRSSDLWVRFRGPAVGLGIPFELLRNEDDYLALNHILTRKLPQDYSRKPEPFSAFLETLVEQGEPLRLLIVGANSDGTIPSAEEEAASLASDIDTDLRCLGIMPDITLLTGVDATYDNVRQTLQDDRYHIFHYAGHGRYDDTLPEISGLVLRRNTDRRILSAADLRLLAQDTELRLVFLSCCLGARTAAQTGRGDFRGMLEAIVAADVPVVLGYRWVVKDASAKLMAETFYHVLWQSFSPGEALYRARRNIAMAEQGRDNETWASSVLVVQTD